ncbi:hypothetical protein K502DRAFT_326131 [Neoconidiobolus thromboides FSU 785]|nr:hypothetical protein K502DRAFT_326131 [Neoconidiobolus thromboides FSU 785]
MLMITDKAQRERRHRIHLTDKQYEILLSYYKINNKPCRDLVTQIALDADLTTKTVRIWFQNKRAKFKVTGEYDHQPQRSVFWNPVLNSIGYKEIENNQKIKCDTQNDNKGLVFKTSNEPELQSRHRSFYTTTSDSLYLNDNQNKQEVKYGKHNDCKDDTCSTNNPLDINYILNKDISHKN